MESKIFVRDYSESSWKAEGFHSTKEGYLTGSILVTCAGVFPYLADGGKVVQRLRAIDDVRESVKTLANKPVTLNHPDELVTPDNAKELSVGFCSNDVYWDGMDAFVTVTITDRKAIDAIKAEESGFSCYEWLATNDMATRESHAALNGMICRYDDDSVYSDDGGKTWKKRTSGMYHGAPGTDFNCRCTALPWVAELEDEFEKQRPKGDVRGVVQSQENLKPVQREKPKRKLTAREVLGIIREEQESIPTMLKSLLRNVKNTISDEAKNNVFGLKVQTESETALDSLKKINPNYKPGSTSWSKNCANCVNAYVARRRGFDVSAKSFDRKGDHKEYRIPEKGNAGFLSSFENPEFIAVGNDGFDSFEKKMLDNAQKSGPGAIFILSGNAYQTNHVIVLENVGGKILFIDPQDSTVSENIPIKMYSYDGYSRVDKLKFSKKLKFYTRNGS